TPEAACHAIDTEDRAALMDSLILCKFLRGAFTDLFAEAAELLSMVTGWNVTADELRTTAQRIVVAKKLYNQREGWSPAEDTLPRGFRSEPLPGPKTPEVAATSGVLLPRERLLAMIQAYYQGRGWDERGRVPAAQIDSLQLADLSS